MFDIKKQKLKFLLLTGTSGTAKVFKVFKIFHNLHFSTVCGEIDPH